jgi:hypothetical protein
MERRHDRKGEFKKGVGTGEQITSKRVEEKERLRQVSPLVRLRCEKTHLCRKKEPKRGFAEADSAGR